MTEHDQIEQLAALLDGDLDTATVPDDLASLLTLAGHVRDHAEVLAPTPAFRASLREDLLAAAATPPGPLARAREAWSVRTAGLRSSARVAVATMTASSMLGTAGVAVAAQEAVPGDLLYGVKTLTEDARLLLATDDVSQARLHLAFARERLEELRAGADRLGTDEVVQLLASMDEHSQQGADALLEGVSGGVVDPDELRTFTRLQRDGLVGLFSDLPLLARPIAEDSLELLRRIEVNATGIVRAGADCDCDPSGRTGVTTTPTTSRPVTRPGTGPALVPGDCDCIELPGGIQVREPSRTAERDQADTAEREGATSASTDDGAEPEPEPERESPFAPSGSLSDPRADDDTGGDGDDGSALDTSASADQLPLRETTRALDGSLQEATGTDVDSGGVVARTEDGVTALLD